MLSWEEIQKAQKRLAGVANRTPVLLSRQFNEIAGCSVFFKAENFQRGGAFKFRGAYNKIHAACESHRISRIVAYSSGNHAQAVALSARLHGIAATIVMPKDAPLSKIEATKSYGADIIFYDRYTENREAIGARIAEESEALLVPPFDDYLIMAGQATTAVELIEDAGPLDVLLTPASGNGLIAGCSVAAKHLLPSIQLYGVEPEAGNDTYLSLQKGERISIAVPQTIADGLQTAAPGELTFPIVQRLITGILLVSDQELAATLKWMLERMKVLVEPSGAAAASAVQFKKAGFHGKRVGVVLSGGNIDLLRLKGFL